jgi:hypothetical protein
MRRYWPGKITQKGKDLLALICPDIPISRYLWIGIGIIIAIWDLLFAIWDFSGIASPASCKS